MFKPYLNLWVDLSIRKSFLCCKCVTETDTATNKSEIFQNSYYWNQKALLNVKRQIFLFSRAWASAQLQTPALRQGWPYWSRTTNGRSVKYSPRCLLFRLGTLIPALFHTKMVLVQDIVLHFEHSCTEVTTQHFCVCHQITAEITCCIVLLS